MKKSSKALIIGFIALWVVVFGLMWMKTLVKKGKPGDLASLKQTATKINAKSVAGEPAASPAKKPGHGKELEAGAGGEEQKEAVPVRCYKVAPTDFKDDLPVMGTIKGGLEIPLKFEINGVIDSINFREGDVINKGDIIASINKKDAQLKVDYSKSKLESAKTQALAAKKKYEIHKTLYDIGGIIKAKLEEVELEAKSDVAL